MVTTIPSKRRQPSTTLHGPTFQKTPVLTLIPLRTSYFIDIIFYFENSGISDILKGLIPLLLFQIAYLTFPPSFPSALELRVSFGLVNNQLPFFSILHLSCSSADVDFRSIHPSEADCLVSEIFSFYGVRLLASRPTPNLEDQGIPLRQAPTP
jgi:hypothetical protein